MSSDIWVKSGIYDPTKRFEFTNIDSEPFTFSWGKVPITVKPDEKVQLRHHLAVLATTQLVDKIMTREIKEEETKVRADTKNENFVSRRGISLGVPAARKPYEDKILKELPPRTDSDAQLQVIRTEITEELVRDLKNSDTTPPQVQKISDLGITGIKEFEDINLPHVDK